MQNQYYFILIFFTFTLLHKAEGQVIPPDIIAFANKTFPLTNQQFQPGTALYSKFFAPVTGSPKSIKTFKNDTLIDYFEYNTYGKPILYEYYKNGTLEHDHRFIYNDGKIKAERGQWDIDYVHLDEDNFLAISKEIDKKIFYISTDTAYYYMGDETWRVKRYYEDDLFDSDTYEHNFHSDGRLKNSKTYFNEIHVKQNTFIYDSLDRLKQIKWIDFENFSSELRVHDVFKNRVYNYSYDENGLIDSMAFEVFENKLRKWVVYGQYSYDYDYSRNDGIHQLIKKKYSKGHLIETVTFKINDHNNWVFKRVERNNRKAIQYNRTLEYY